MPVRIFTETGTRPAAASTAATTMLRNRSRFQGRALPPPLRVTLGTGQPKLRSTWSARSSSTRIRTASAITCGSTPYSCTERGLSSAWKQTRSIVSALRSSSARDVTISETYSPATAPVASTVASRQSERKARLVIPAIGARTTGGSKGRGTRRFSHPAHGGGSVRGRYGDTADFAPTQRR